MAKNDELIRNELGSIAEGAEPIAFDKNASWQKLNRRLQPQRKKVVFKPAYRWAAAAILLLTITVAMLNRPKDVNVADTIHPISHTDRKATFHKPKVKVSILKTKDIATYTHKPTPEYLQLHEVPLPETLTPIVFTIKPPKPSESIAKAKPKMKVIHMNDLAEIEHIEKELKQVRYVFGHNNTNNNNSDYIINEDFELPEQFRDDHTLKQ